MNRIINLKDFMYYNRKVVIASLLIIIVIIIYLFTSYYSEDDIVVEDSNLFEVDEDLEKEVEEQYLYVDVKGCVKIPGIYKLGIDNRVIDAINMAGGLLDEADTSSINLSMKLKDEMVIIVEKKGDSLNENLVNDAKIEVKGEDTNLGINNKISINTATVSELTKIKGLGEVKAKKIVEYREKNGKFKNLEDIKKVSGIGNATYEKIKDYLTI